MYVVFVSVDSIVIPPSSLLIDIFEPAVKVATVGPLVPPIKSSPFASITAEDNLSVPDACDIITALSEKDVAPVPPSPTESVPVILDAPKSTANSVDSITIPPLVLRSVESEFPDLVRPSPAVIFSAPENSLHTILSLFKVLIVDVIT